LTFFISYAIVYTANLPSLCSRACSNVVGFSFYGAPMKYTKPPLSFEQQANLLLARGLTSDRNQLIEKLKAVSYYRLSGYWHTFRKPDDTFILGTTLDDVWQRYTFDRQLRLLILDAIERVEISVRTSLVYHHSHAFGPFGYTSGHTMPTLNKNDFLLLQGQLREAVRQSKAPFAVHFKDKYGDTHADLPFWMLAEVMSFGMLFTMFRGLDKGMKRTLAQEYNLKFGVLQSWLHCLNAVRNICAHHGRLWNRVLGVKPLIPAKDPLWRNPVVVRNDRVFGTLTLLKNMLKLIAPQSSWQQRLEALFARYPYVPIAQMGFPPNWKSCPIWQ